MPSFLIAYLASVVAFFAMDFTWLSLTMKSLYKAKIGHLLADQPNFPVAILFYIFYVAGIVFFAVMPASSWIQALLTGALLGVFAYATYDMTNWATLRDWSATLSIIDMIWGGVATGTAATAGYFAIQYFAKR